MKRAFICLLLFSVLPFLMAFRWPWQSVGDSGRIELSGTVEAREVDLAFQVSGRITRLLVDEGDAVKAEQLIAELDARDYELALRNTIAQAEAAQAALAALQAGTRVQELRVAEAQLAKAQADLDYARVDFKRVADLVSRKLAPEDQLDQARQRQNVALAGVEQAQQNPGAAAGAGRGGRTSTKPPLRLAPGSGGRDCPAAIGICATAQPGHGSGVGAVGGSR
ncbi:MAG: biotin/lipoyl-binding protein [Candidatus Competibacteraceae bacterium]